MTSHDLPGNKLSSILPLLHPECQALPEPNLLPGQLSHGAVGMRHGKVLWLSMAFESVSTPFSAQYTIHTQYIVLLKYICINGI